MLLNDEQFRAIALSCQNSSIGKRLPNALYVHTSAVTFLDAPLRDYERQARVTDKIEGATLIKFSTDKPKISYLFYPDFDCDPHPALQFSVVVDMETLQASYWDYATSDNPPILHRKETFVASDYPLYQEFTQLTDLEEKLGLLDNSRFIGTRLEWQQRLDNYRIAFDGHRLICPIDGTSTQLVSIDRHKAAIPRKSLSRPVRLALEAGLFVPEVTTFFDYGCGYGSDIDRIAEKGYSSSGWDPYYRPNTPRTPADIVNLGYVINVIEDLVERRQALLQAWELTRQVLIVAAQVLIDDRDRGVVAYGDGIITSRNTFQKYYEQEELKTYIDQVLNVDSIPAGLGIYFVFRDKTQAETFRVSRFRSRTNTPKIQTTIKRFEDYENLLIPLMEFVTQRGRLPVKGELENESELRVEFDTIRRAFQVVLQVTDKEEWDAIAQKRRQDLLLYLALSRFGNRPKPRQLSSTVREDIKALFGGYKQACILADAMLLSLRDLDKIAALCQNSPIGKKFRNSLLIHISALETLEPLLRLYEGCASRTVGRLEEANLIQFFFNKPKISYLVYPDFDLNPHPTLQAIMDIYLGNLTVRYRDFNNETNPPILHEKEALVLTDYPLYEKFAKLTRKEKDWGLLDDFSTINRLQGWLKCLEDRCAVIKGYQLQWNKDADPYKVKLLRSQINARKQNQ
ncbi:DNA phosphorothioation-associated putative methyltransferase [Pleurocapsa sp. PCC 7327]|uniref:DNA phosphorothioation-associated putative methyltransferase n=1 Tax=Pleurocapsa sp. PCC 7327 TaxID=118163 RepID=UPI00029FD5EF|nr:DNA phosphorothioation-associated putative methyltransferase [Pleurocapsa sp. PCC 7327]AFY75946.1 DNA phosphorothioation-associated putative methyltransferase [Pleurocapsa sp. PCC 7327]